MVFNSVKFLIFLPFTAGIYFILPERFRVSWLLICSYIFYLCYKPKYIIYIIATTAVTYLSGIIIEHLHEKEGKEAVKQKKLIVFLTFAINIGILITFKYTRFFIKNAIRIFAAVGVKESIALPDIIMPLGISFYTFIALSYTMDVYRKNIKAEKNIIKYALFVSFFPQVISGPIQKAKNMLFQYDRAPGFDYDRVRNGLLRLTWGYFQKVFVADRIAVFVNTVYNDPSNHKGFEVIIATVFYAFQIYIDFCSVSDMALGIAEIFGYRLTENFKSPYFAKSIKEFWKRWHMSLCSWFMDYLYIPLGGNRKGKFRKYINIMIVFLVSGLWHGAAVNFIIWGALHGIYQIVEYEAKPLRENLVKVLKIRTETFSFKLFQMAVTFILVDFAWIFFRANRFSDAVIILKNMAKLNPWIFTDGTIFKLGLDNLNFAFAILGICIVLGANLLQRKFNVREKLSQQNVIFRWAVYIAAAVMILIFGVYGPGFNKQQFIYMQF